MLLERDFSDILKQLKFKKGKIKAILDTDTYNEIDDQFALVQMLFSKEKIDAINDRTRHGGAEIVKFLKTGSAYYAPSASAVAMVEAILLDSGRILPACALLKGQYGVNDLYCGVPVELGKRGIKRIIELELNDSELSELQNSVKAVKELGSTLFAGV